MEQLNEELARKRESFSRLQQLLTEQVNPSSADGIISYLLHSVMLIIFRRNINYERKIFSSEGWFFSPESASSEWTCSRFLEAPKCSYARRMQFRQPCSKIFVQSAKKFIKFSFFQKFFFVAKCSSGHVECTFDNYAKNCWLKVQIWFQSFDVSKKCWKCSSGHVECTFDNYAKNCWLKVQIWFQSFDISKKCWKCSSGLVEMSFANTNFCLMLYLLQ